MDSAQSEDGHEFDIQSISRWLNSNGIYLLPADQQVRGIHLHIDKVILVSEKSLIGEVRELIMGDRFEKIGAGATIVNRSALANSMNRVRTAAGDDFAHTLEHLAQVVEESQNPAAIENFNAFSEELEKPQPRKALLKSFWNGITAALPAAAEIVGLADNISRLFT